VAVVRIREGEAFEQALRRFKKSCEKSGMLTELKKREHFEKPSVRKKKKSMAARKRALKKGRPRPAFNKDDKEGKEGKEHKERSY
jgi:small subunit ribosomal protein S21